MELTFRSRHVPVTDSLRKYANRKLSRLGRYLPVVDEVVVELEQEGGEHARRYVVQLTVNCDGTYLRVEERGSRLLPTIDAAADVLSRQARRYKEKVYHSDKHVKARQAALAGKAAEPVEVEEEEEREEEEEEETEIVLGRVVRIKRFPVKPMSEEEAIQQMELLDHDFFLFFDADTNTYALLYRRREGDYGMIIPEAL
jgi:putative sigma-54 modulation protein